MREREIDGLQTRETWSLDTYRFRGIAEDLRFYDRRRVASLRVHAYCRGRSRFSHMQLIPRCQRCPAHDPSQLVDKLVFGNSEATFVSDCVKKIPSASRSTARLPMS